MATARQGKQNQKQKQKQKRKAKEKPRGRPRRPVAVPDVPMAVTREQVLKVIRDMASGGTVDDVLARVVAETTGAQSVKKESRRERLNAEEKTRALELVASGLKQRDVAKSVGVHEKTLSTWVCRARKNGEMPEASRDARRAETTAAAGGADAQQTESAKQEDSSIKPSTKLYTPKDPGQGLAEYEKDAILELKRKHPSYGPAQVRAQLKRFKGWRMSIKTIAKVFRDNGYQLVHRGSRPEGPEPIRFEAPRRNALWQMDFAEMRIVGEKLHLCVALDDFSRFVVGHALAEHPSCEVSVGVLQNAIARHGRPESLRTDRGGGFLGEEFTSILEACVVDHIVGRSYHPQGGGKVESIIGTIRRELWDVEQFENREHALQRTAEFIDDYNERRAHMGIDGLTPADRYFGRADRVLAAVNAASRNRNGAISNSSKVFEELVAPNARAPMEVLRLVMMNGKLELRFCGARIELGNIESA